MAKRGTSASATPFSSGSWSGSTSGSRLVDELLKIQHDFTVDEEMITDPDAVDLRQERRRGARHLAQADQVRPAGAQGRQGDKAEAPSRTARKRSRSEKKELGKKPTTRRRRKLSSRYHSFAKRMHQTDSDELLEMYLTSLTTSYDPHTTYMSPSSLENFDIQMRLKLEGIGAALQFTDGYTVVSKIIPGGAADKDKRHLKPEDKIIGVGQGDGRRNRRRHRHEAQRRGQADPRQARHRASG